MSLDRLPARLSSYVKPYGGPATVPLRQKEIETSNARWAFISRAVNVEVVE